MRLPTRRSLLPLALALAGGWLLAPAAPAAAEGPSQVTFEGHGYGHGIGMSQYGAYGAAREGRTQRQITAFYYPGTEVGRASGKVRVRLSGDADGDVVVEARPRLRVRDLGRSGAAALTRLPDNGARQWRLRPGAGSGGAVVSFRDDRQWRFWRRLSGGGELDAQGSAVTLVTAAGPRRYRGALRLAAGETVNVLGLDNYLKGVVPLEMPAAWAPAAVQAQAVAARSYAAWERQHPRGDHFDVHDTVASQVYGGFGAEHPDSNRAVERTAGEVRTSGGRPAFTQFSSSNGGHTAPGSQPYLRARPDPYDGWSGNPNHDWRTSVPASAFESRWPGIGDLTGVRVVRRDGHGEWNGRALQVRITGSRGSTTVSGPDLRFALGLRSHWFRVV